MSAELRYVSIVAGRGEPRGIALSAGATGAVLLRELLQGALEAYPEAFPAFELPADADGFKSRCAELLPRFEALRVCSGKRAEIARHIALDAEARLRFVDGADERPIATLWHDAVEPLPIVRVDLPGERRLVPSARYDGKVYVGLELEALADGLDEARLASRAACRALSHIARRASEGEGLSLEGQRFVLIGAGAELSPVYALLAAGAEVLWLDLSNPPIERLLEPRLGGALYYVNGGIDLLARPAAVRATLLAFAAGQPLHLGLYACASGGAREARLAIAMNALARSLPPAQLASISCLLSPMSVSPIQPEDAERADARRDSASTLERTLRRTGPLSAGHVTGGDVRIACAVVSQQGTSFQVAEYVGKRLAAEAFATYGSALDPDAPTPLIVSANMAPITSTRSLATPLLSAAASGAADVHILIAEPKTAREISTLLMLHDVLSLDSPESTPPDPSARLAALFARQFHGGVHAQPYALEGLVRVAALRGIAHHPKLALGLLR